ncbi:site-specific integrase [Clostridium subterminale]|uniref:Site-specific integrase n=1 Tax=Clostridium subterminale TaxID=1550 RepID=A0ABP3W2F2_CLOSU
MEYNITYRQKDKGWQFIISYKDDNGKWKQKSKQGFKTKKDAKPVAENMLDEIKNKMALDIPVEFTGITFKEFSEMHIKHLKLSLEYNSIQTYCTVLVKFNKLNDMEMSKIKPIHIQNIVDDMVNVNKESSIKTYLQKLKTTFKAAVEQYNIIVSNPVQNIRIKVDKNIQEKTALNTVQSKGLLSKIKNPKYYLITIIALECGLRIGEIMGLTWDDINMKDKVINVNKQWKVINDKGDYGFGSVKSKNSNRVVPMSKNVYKTLEDYKFRNLDGRILNYKNTSATTGELRRTYIKLGYSISVHELRHTYATNLIARGLDFKTVAKLMGHDVEQTMKTYSHVTDEMLQKAFNLINNF